MRIAELAKLYRYEGSGELSGLVRVRSFCLADAHIICTDKDQASTEIDKALDLIEYIASVFGLKLGENYSYRLSLGDKTDDKKYYKNDDAWDEGEAMLRLVLQNRKGTFVEATGEAAFYGPKIDVQMKDARGKENTAFTVQYDFCMPDRFNLTYIDTDGKEKRPVVVHRSSIGAIERVMAFLIEHYAGAFPTWLAPVQVKILPISEAHHDYAESIAKELRTHDIRVELDATNESLGKRIRSAKMEKIPYLMVVGDKEIEAKTVSLESRKEGALGSTSLAEALTLITLEITEKR